MDTLQAIKLDESPTELTAEDIEGDHNLLLAIRSGGHNGPGLGTYEGGLVIDLSLMKGIHVDPESKPYGPSRVTRGMMSITPRMRSDWPPQAG